MNSSPSTQMRILFVSESSPFESTCGAEQRSFFLHSALQELGIVDVLLVYDRVSDGAPVTRLDSGIVEVCWPSGLFGVNRLRHRAAFTRRLRAVADFHQYDLICGRHLWPVAGLTIPRTIPVLLDLDDAGFRYPPEQSLIRFAVDSAKERLRGLLEAAAVRRYAGFWFVSERDRRRFRAVRARILPNIPRHPVTCRQIQSSDMLVLFVGALWYDPNRLGVEWFLESCWPAIRAAHPTACFRIVGEASRAQDARWSGIPGVEVAGFVDDLAIAYGDAALTVAPIFSGGGSNIKVLESLAHCRACVTTTFALSAFEPHLQAGRHLEVADTAAETVDAVGRLLDDPVTRGKMADAGKSAVDHVFSRQGFRREVHALVAEVVGAGVPARGRQVMRT